jgi:hypothetical protein
MLVAAAVGLGAGAIAGWAIGSVLFGIAIALAGAGIVWVSAILGTGIEDTGKRSLGEWDDT